MAAPTMALQTFQGIGNREDLEEAFYMITPTQTPFLTMCERTKATNTKHEWLTDQLGTQQNNAMVEGDDATGAPDSTATVAVRYNNFIQSSGRYAVVTDNQEAVTSAGKVNNMAHQVAKRMAELKLDMEYTLTRNYGSSAGSAAIAANLASLECWLWGSRTANGGGATDGGTSTMSTSTLGNSISYGSSEATTPVFNASGFAAPTDSSSTSAFTVKGLKALIKNCWTAGGDPQVIMCNGGTKQVISGFAGIATIYREAGKTSKGTAIVGAADWEQWPLAA